MKPMASRIFPFEELRFRRNGYDRKYVNEGFLEDATTYEQSGKFRVVAVMRTQWRNDLLYASYLAAAYRDAKEVKVHAYGQEVDTVPATTEARAQLQSMEQYRDPIRRAFSRIEIAGAPVDEQSQFVIGATAIQLYRQLNKK